MMNLNNLFRLANNFYYAHTFITIGIVAALVIIACLKPKQTFKTILLFLGVLVAGYIIYCIGEATMAGISEKGQMVNQ